MSTPSVPNGHDRTGSGSPAPAGPENPQSAESRGHESRTSVTRDGHDRVERDNLQSRIEEAKERHSLTSEEIEKRAREAVRVLRSRKQSSSVEACRAYLKEQGLSQGRQNSFREAVKAANALHDRWNSEAATGPEVPEDLAQLGVSNTELVWRRARQEACPASFHTSSIRASRPQFQR